MHEVRDAEGTDVPGRPWAIFSLWAFTVSWELLMDFEQRRMRSDLFLKDLCVCVWGWVSKHLQGQKLGLR